MYFFRFSWILTGLIVISVFNWQCAEEPIVADLSHLSQTADTLTLHSITGFTYQVPPEIGSIKRLYVGTKGELYFPFTFFKIHSYGSDGTGWDSLLDTAITIDSVRFKLYSNDSLISSDIGIHLYFLPDSFFSELESNYIDYPSFSFSEWIDLYGPSTSQVIDTTDTAEIYTETVLSWEISADVLETLTDTTDSNLVRTFGIGYPPGNLDSTFLEIYSREYSSGSHDPKIEVYYRQEMYVASESSPIDTLMKTFYTVGDLSIVNPGEGYDVSPGEIAVSQGKGFRSVSYTHLTLPTICSV